MTSFLDSADNAIRVRNPGSGQWEMWTPRQVLAYSTTAPQTTGPNGVQTSPLIVDRNWYMSEGPGRYFTPDRFKVVNDVFDKSYDDLLAKGLRPGGAAVSLENFVQGQGGNATDRASISNYTLDIGSDDFAARAFIWGGTSARITGSVRMMQDGSVVVENLKVSPFDDNFNFNTDGKAARYIEDFNREWKARFGEHTPVPLDFEQNAEAGKIQGTFYKGDIQQFKSVTVEKSIASPIDVMKVLGGISTAVRQGYEPVRCFIGDTLIALPNGTSRRIDAIDIGESVLSFDPYADGGRGNLVSGVVTKLFNNVTTEWLQLDFALSNDGTARRPLIATPGHETLKPEGGFARLDAMVVWTSKDTGSVTIVNQDASISTASVTRINYSAATADMFEQAVMMTGGGTAGNTAFKQSETIGWKTYNFEVSGTHTYIAEGVRVHNLSAWDALDLLYPNGEGLEPGSAFNVKEEVIDGMRVGTEVEAVAKNGDIITITRENSSGDTTVFTRTVGITGT